MGQHDQEMERQPIAGSTSQIILHRWGIHVTIGHYLIYDEYFKVHQLNDEARGPTVEAIVSRMKTVRASVQQREGATGQKQMSSIPLRFIAVSATIPNIHDVKLTIVAYTMYALLSLLDCLLAGDWARSCYFYQVIYCYRHMWIPSACTLYYITFSNLLVDILTDGFSTAKVKLAKCI